MRKFVFILLFCLPFVSSFAKQTNAAVTKASALAPAKKAAPGIISGRLQTESGAEITSTAYSVVSAFVKRAEQAKEDLYSGQGALLPCPLTGVHTSGIIKRSDEHPPLYLLLLFPEHFFW